MVGKTYWGQSDDGASLNLSQLLEQIRMIIISFFSSLVLNWGTFFLAFSVDNIIRRDTPFI